MTRDEAVARLAEIAMQHDIQAERLSALEEPAFAYYAANVDALKLGIEALKERDLVYGELNKALGSHAPKAWERIKAGLTS